jgi:hypothetical protein
LPRRKGLLMAVNSGLQTARLARFSSWLIYGRTEDIWR